MKPVETITAPTSTSSSLLAHVEVDRVRRAGGDALVALRADAAVEAAAGGRARLLLGEGGSSSAKSVGAAAKRAAAASGSRTAVAALPGEHVGLVDDAERLVEAVELEALQPAVDHVRGPAAVPDRLRDRRRAGDDVAGGEDPRHGASGALDAGVLRARVREASVSGPMPIATITTSQATSS